MSTPTAAATSRADLFLCHHAHDSEWARSVAAQIESTKFPGRALCVRLDPWDIDPGQNRLAHIEEGLLNSHFVMIALSADLLASDLGWLQMTAALATDPANRQGRLIIGLVCSYSSGRRLEIPGLLAGLPQLDFRTDSMAKRSVKRLVATLRQGDEEPGAPVPAFASRRSRPLPPPLQKREDADPIAERLISNLLPVRELPLNVWSAPTALRQKKDLPRGISYPPFVLQPPNLLSFEEPCSPESGLHALLSAPRQTRIPLAQWMSRPCEWRWAMQLLNETLRRCMGSRGILCDRDGRFFVTSQTDSSVHVRWSSGHERQLVWPRVQKLQGLWAHEAARLRFETLGTFVALSVTPGWAFTTNGFTPVEGEPRRALLQTWAPPERNKAILTRTLLWADLITWGRPELVIRIGSQRLVLARNPAQVRADKGIGDDFTQLGALDVFERVDRGESITSEFGLVEHTEPEPEK